MEYLKILNKIKENKGINKYVILDARVIGGNSATGDIIKINLKKVINGDIINKEIFILPTFKWEESLYKPTGVSFKQAKRGISFTKAYKKFITFTKGFVVIANQARGIQKTFVKNCKRANIAIQPVPLIDSFFLARLAHPLWKYKTLGGFADNLKINYDKKNIEDGFNICDLIEKVSINSIKAIIKENKKPKFFIDYERDYSDSKMRMYSRFTIFFMLIALIIFMAIKL